MKKLFLIIIISQLICSCKQPVFLQHKYVKGIYREKLAKSGDPGRLRNKLILLEEKTAALKVNVKQALQEKDEPVFATAGAMFPVIKKVEKLKRLHDDTNNEYCGDTIFLKDKRKIACKVQEVTETELRYKDCKDWYLSLKTIQTEKVLRVKFQNGVEETFPEKSVFKSAQPEPSESPDKHLKGEKFAIFGYILVFISGIISLLASPFIGIPLMLISVFGMTVIKGNYKVNKYLIKALIILGGIIGGLFLLLLAIGLIGLIVLISVI